MVQAICKEIELQKDYLAHLPLKTIYLGGGTPSLLDEQELDAIFSQIYKTFTTTPDIEITIECNPDDITPQQLALYKSYTINRLSIGIQSFNSEHLKYLNRAHDSKSAYQSIRLAQEMGLENMSIDLIYGIPADNHSIWEADLKKAVELNPPHISAYCLTIEEKTVFGNWLKKNKIKPIEDEFASIQFDMLLNFLETHQFEQYEISNFARDQHYSKHNCNYWVQESYLGIGPGAHSYNKFSRQHNIAHNIQYIKAIEQNETPYTTEILSFEDQFNEYIMTSLRTSWGTDLEVLENKFAIDIRSLKKPILERYMQLGLLQFEGKQMKLSRSGKLLADEIIQELFINH